MAACRGRIPSKITQIWTAVPRKSSKLSSSSGRKVLRRLCRRRRTGRSTTGAPFEFFYGAVDERNLGQSVPKLRWILPAVVIFNRQPRFLCRMVVLMRRLVGALSLPTVRRRIVLMRGLVSAVSLLVVWSRHERPWLGGEIRENSGKWGGRGRRSLFTVALGALQDSVAGCVGGSSTGSVSRMHANGSFSRRGMSQC